MQKKSRKILNPLRIAPIRCLDPLIEKGNGRETVFQLDGERNRCSCKGSIWTFAFDHPEVQPIFARDGDTGTLAIPEFFLFIRVNAGIINSPIIGLLGLWSG